MLAQTPPMGWNSWNTFGHKIIVFLLTFVVIVGTNIFGVTNVSADIDVKSHEGEIYVSGQLPASYENQTISLLLLKNNADASTFELDDLVYINEDKIGEDGKYSFLFECSANVDLSKCYFYTRVGNEDVTKSIIKTELTSADLFEYSVSLTQDNVSGTATVSIKNIFNDNSLTSDGFIPILAFYGKDGRMLDAFVGTENQWSLTANKPNDTLTIKAFVWSGFDTMRSYCMPAVASEVWKSAFYSDDENFFNLNTTFYGDAHTTRAFAWEAKPIYKNMVIQYGTSRDDLTEKSAVYTKMPVSYGINIPEGLSSNAVPAAVDEELLFYKTDISELTSGTAYFYRIGDKEHDIWSDWYEFKTEPDDMKEFSFIAVTDPQGTTEDAYIAYGKTLKAAMTDCPDAKFVVNAGDLTENVSYDDWYHYFFDASENICESLPLMTVVGNHETRGYGVGYYNLHFNNPQNGKGLGENASFTGLGAEQIDMIENLDNTVYSFDYGNAHFTVLNTGSDWYDSQVLMNLQKQWLKNDLESTTKEWKILLLHRGIYGAQDRGAHVKNAFLDIVDEYGVDLVIQGHDHTYMRTYAMKNDAVVSDSKTNIEKGIGTIYSVIGSAAYKRYEVEVQDHFAVLYNLPSSKPNYVVIKVSDKEISFISKLTDGTIVDQFVIKNEK